MCFQGFVNGTEGVEDIDPVEQKLRQAIEEEKTKWVPETFVLVEKTPLLFAQVVFFCRSWGSGPPSSLMLSLRHRHTWATRLVAGRRLSPWEVHPEGGNCRESHRLQAKFAWGTESPAGYQVRANGALYPCPEAHLEEGNFKPKPGLERDGLGQALFAHDTPHVRGAPTVTMTMG